MIVRLEPEMIIRLVCLGVLAVAAACGPQIGDDCERSSACGAGLTCDLATPGGYCTQTPCRPGECPDEAVCIDFGTERTWCMRTCSSDDDCREGLVCLPAPASPTVDEPRRCLDAKGGKSCRFCGHQPAA